MSNLRSIAPELAKAIGGMNQLPRDSRMMDGMGQQPGMSDFAQKQMRGLGQQMDSYMQTSPAMKQMQDLQNQIQRGQITPQAYTAQAEALNAQLRDYQQKAPMMQQIRALQQQGQGVPDFAQPYMQGLQQQMQGVPDKAMFKDSLQRAQALQQFQQAQQLNNAMQGVPDFAQPYMQGLQQIPSPNAMQGVPDFAQPYMQGLGAAASRTGGMFQQPKRATPRSNPMTGLGAFSANPSIAAANPFAGLGVTAGAQRAQQTVQPPYDPGLDDSRMGDNFGRQPSGFGQPMGQLFGIGQAMGQPQTQQSPYAQQQASNLMQQQQYSLGQPQNFNPMQNAGQVGQGVYGSFVGQRQQPQPAMQQQTPQQQQNPAQAMQGSVAPPMQAGFNFFDQSQAQNNTGGGNTGGGGLF
jgi:hypothetical protein